MKVQRICFALLCVVLFLSACNSGKEYPQLLVDADSAMVHGRYDEADSLLARYHDVGDNEATTMYWKLLVVGMRDKKGRPLDNLSLADSLCFYYSRQHDNEKYGRALLYLGGTYRYLKDYKKALEQFMKAEEVASSARLFRLLSWIELQKGDNYYDVLSFDEMVECYRREFEYASLLRDSFQLCLAVPRMAMAYTHLDNVDSAVFYNKMAMQWGRTFHVKDVEQKAKNELADIFIQIEELDSAKQYLEYQTDNAYYWGDYFRAQNKLDSAAYYYDLMFRTTKDAYVGVEVLRELIDVSTSRHDDKAALFYYGRFVTLQDSLMSLNYKNELHRTEARYNYEQMKEERNLMARRNTFLTWIGCALLLLSLLCFAAYRRYERLQREKKEAELAAALAEERMLRQDAQRASELNEQQAAANRERIRSLERQMELLRRQGEEAEAQRLQVESRQLQAETQSLEAERQRRTEAQEELERSPLLARMRANAGNDKFRMKEDDWEELRRLVDAVDNNLTQRLLRLHPLRVEELRVCYLTKLGFAPADMALLLSKSQAAVSMMRLRMYQKLSGRRGSASDFEQLIAQL